MPDNLHYSSKLLFLYKLEKSIILDSQFILQITAHFLLKVQVKPI